MILIYLKLCSPVIKIGTYIWFMRNYKKQKSGEWINKFRLTAPLNIYMYTGTVLLAFLFSQFMQHYSTSKWKVAGKNKCRFAVCNFHVIQLWPWKILMGGNLGKLAEEKDKLTYIHYDPIYEGTGTGYRSCLKLHISK